MSKQDFSQLLQQWQEQADQHIRQTPFSFSIYQDDLERIDALAKLYGLPGEQIARDLMHSALQALEASMPYIPGPRVIREEEGEPIYEDIGPKTSYLRLRQSLQRK